MLGRCEPQGAFLPIGRTSFGMLLGLDYASGHAHGMGTFRLYQEK